MDATSIGGPLAVLAAGGTAITVLTEVLKQYVPEDSIPPPVLAAFLAAAFTFAWELSRPTPPLATDIFDILMIWFALFQVSIGVYHGTQLAQGRRARSKPRAGTILEVSRGDT